jgi:hypothetical protein
MIAWSRIGLNPGDFRVCKQKLDQGADKLGSNDLAPVFQDTVYSQRDA